MKKSYSVKEVEAYKTRMVRQHSKDMAHARLDYYQRGKRDGKNELRRAFWELLRQERAAQEPM